ncbi:hypothetical protein SAMN05443246_2991 [Paenibacillus sp. GP183]|nr:hypothetical protein SAMN05443246_2991 [Paenibacillus sp. GP183]
MIILMEYISVNILILLVAVLLWINDGQFSLLDFCIVFLLAISGVIFIRMRFKGIRIKKY